MAQTAGLVELNVGLETIDFAVFAGHKSLFAPTGIAGFVMNSSIKLEPVIFGGTGCDSANQNMPATLPERFEPGTPNVVGLAGLNTSLKWIQAQTTERLFALEESRRQLLLEILTDYDFLDIVGLTSGRKYVGIVSCLVKGIPSDIAGNIFAERGIAVRTGLQCAPLAHKFLGTFPAGTVRFSVNCMNSDKDFAALRSVLEEMKYGCLPMSFLELRLKTEYRSRRDNVIKDFYNPVLTHAVLYKRAVGFFSSSALAAMSTGICALIKNGGLIQMIASPCLSQEDFEAIKYGFKRRNDVIKEALLRELKTPKENFVERRLNLLSNLIALGRLDFRIAFIENSTAFGMFHEKLGIVHDAAENVIAFSGSMNESANAFFNNYESIDVFTSWSHDAGRVAMKEAAFDLLWKGTERGVKVLDFPEVREEFLRRYKTNDRIDTSFKFPPPEIKLTPVKTDTATTSKNCPAVPSSITLRDYQISAIEKWNKRNFSGIFDMVTGTGKTFTALAAISRLFAVKKNLAVLIVCPYQHLIEQWREDITFFGMKPIVCHSESSQRNWRERLKTTVESFNGGLKKFFCMVCTNATFSTDSVQKLMKKLSGEIVLIVDEAHHFGAKNLKRILLPHIPYRLALSDTIEHHEYEEGMQKLFEYFGEKCIEYKLSDAIENNMLTPYRYYPIPVSLTAEEREEYLELTAKIHKSIRRDKYGKIKLTERAKMLLIKRARLVAAAKEKISVLRERIEDFKDDSRILIYCGATTMHDADYCEGFPLPEEERQIDFVVKMLGLELGMRISKFTSKESAQERKLLKKNFAEGKHLQALVAIRCLDEGVNFPGIRMVFILASSTNPKEYIRRRGRFLRKSPGKTCAVVFDFITLPVPLEEVDDYSDKINGLKSLAKRELARLKTFATDAENPFESDSLAFEIQAAYDIKEEDEDYV